MSDKGKRWDMRRIYTGAIIVLLVLAQAPVVWPGEAVAKDFTSYVKVWETKLEDSIKCIPVDASDGSIYGINANLADGEKGKLVKVNEGNLIWSSQDEVRTIGQNVWPIMDFGDKVVFAGLTEDLKKNSNVLEFGFFCYKSDGSRLWEKRYSFEGLIPTYRPYNDKIWLVYDNYVRVLDPLTGNETGKLDLGPSNPKPMSANSVLDGGGGGLGNDNLKLYFMTLSQDMMVLHQLDGSRAYDIAPDSTLKLKWFKRYEPGQLTLFDMLLILQANSEIFVLSNGGGFTCFDSATGQEVWSVDSEDSLLTFYFYNKTHIIKMGLFGSTCYEVKNKKVLWEKGSMILPAAFDENVIVTNATSEEGFEANKNVFVLDITTGNKIMTLKEENVKHAVLSGGNLYLSKESQVAKYSRCNPCACDLEVSWKDSKSEKVLAEICSMESREFSISLKNASKEMTIECSLGSSSGKLRLDTPSLKLEPGKQVLVKATYSSSIDEPDATDCSIFVSSSCGKAAQLLLGVKKNPSCKEKLKKVAQLDSYSSYAFGNILVSVKESEEGDFESLNGTDLSTGKTIWTNGMDKFEGVRNLFIYYMEKDSFICVGKNEEVIWSKVDLTGKIIWQRKGGVLMVPHMPVMTLSWRLDGGEKTIFIFDAVTGKDIISGIDINPRTLLTPVAKYGDKYIFSFERENSLYMFDAKGNKVWAVKNDFCINRNVFSTDHLYQYEEFKAETLDIVMPFKVVFSKVVPDTLKKTWSIDIEGIPEIINETKDRLLLKTRFGIYCIDTAKGKVLWSMTDGKSEYGKVILANGKICVLKTSCISDSNETLSSTMLVLDTETGKIASEFEVGNSMRLLQDEKNVFASGIYDTDEGQWFEIFCFDKTSWKEKWKISDSGYIHFVGSRSFSLGANNMLTWWEDGKPVGKARISSVPSVDDSRGQLKTDWVGDRIYVTATNDLSAYDSKSSALLWSIAYEGGDWFSEKGRHDIYIGNYTFSKGDERFNPDMLMTPCWFDGHVYITSEKKLTVFKPLDK